MNKNVETTYTYLTGGDEFMELIISTRGATIRKCGERFEIIVNDEKKEYSVKKVKKLLITTSIMITSDALKLAVDNSIDVVFLDNFGDPFARVWDLNFGSITIIRRNQLSLSESPLGLILVKEWIGQKINGQINHLIKLKLNGDIIKN